MYSNPNQRMQQQQQQQYNGYAKPGPATAMYSMGDSRGFSPVPNPTVGLDYMALGKAAAKEIKREEPKNNCAAYTIYNAVKNQQEERLQALTKDVEGLSLMDQMAKSTTPEAILARVRHQDEKVVTHSISIAGTLNDFSNGTTKTVWKASNQLKNMPKNVRLLPISNTVLQVRNTVPVKVGVVFDGLHHFELDNAMSGGTDEAPAHYYIEGNVHQPIANRHSLYHRPDIKDDKKIRKMVSNWSSLTHEGIEDSVYKYDEGAPYMYVHFNSPIIDLICKNEELYKKRGIADSSTFTLNDGRKIAGIPTHIGLEVKKLVHDHIDELPFGEPQTFSAKFARADNRSWNDRAGLGGNEDEIEQALDQLHQIDLVFQQRYQVWHPRAKN